MGKDEHKRKSKNRMAQTPKNQLRAQDVEFSQSMADQEDLEAQARAREADRRAQNQKR
ncbi:YfhD family protein [Piscibacillus halophilus]|uniref:YfhD-like protein n=1 Tax=Piscibacillus halophilus TaxID=571933 RepID=A0A1H9L238_9BACI|nr:YfhD family protein [Piscibacillus halophilus]SER05532.1 YfhD-like protein [Piscibacillus halophilus]